MTIDNYIFEVAKEISLGKADLDYAFDNFLIKEEYEKCSVLKKMHYNDEISSEVDKINNILALLDRFDDNSIDKQRFIKELKEELSSFIITLKNKL